MKVRSDWYAGPIYFIIEVPRFEGGRSRFNLRAENFAKALEKVKSLGRTNEDYKKARQINA